MPRSKRAKVVHLSKVAKKGREHTERIYASVQTAASSYAWAYVFSVDNMRNVYLKDVRALFADSRLFFGRTRVMAKALGCPTSSSSSSSTAAAAADEPAPNTHLLGPYMRGAVGLLFSPRGPAEVGAALDAFRPRDFARAGIPADRNFELPAGELGATGGQVEPQYDEPLPASVEPALRRLGVPSRLIRGKVVLDAPFQVCREGELLGAGQAAILKMFGVQAAEFRVELLACWSAEDGAVRPMAGAERMGDGAVGMDVDGDEDADEDEDGNEDGDE